MRWTWRTTDGEYKPPGLSLKMKGVWRVLFIFSFTALLVSCSQTTIPKTPAGTPTGATGQAHPINRYPTVSPGHLPTANLSTPFTTVRASSKVDVPILLYHHISKDTIPDRYYVDPQTFDQQMAWLSAHGYQTITEARLAEVIRSGGDLPDRPVIITFDDGDADLYMGAYPILQKYGFIGVAFLITAGIDTPGEVTSDQVISLINAGWEIGSHTVHHVNLVKYPSKRKLEIQDSMKFLETKFGIKVKSFAYPFGTMNQAAAQLVADSGYTSAAGLGQSIVQSPLDLYYLSRIEIHGTFTMDQFTSLMPWK